MFIEYWSWLKQKNPKLCDDDTKMTISVASFKKQLERAYKAGSDSALIENKGNKINDYTEVFNKLFGGS